MPMPFMVTVVLKALGDEEEFWVEIFSLHWSSSMHVQYGKWFLGLMPENWQRQTITVEHDNKTPMKT